MLYWDEEPESVQAPVREEVVDLAFAIDCRHLPVDHAYPLAEAIVAVLPWMADEPLAGIHQIHVASSQNGWERPDAESDQPLILSRRTKLTLRVPTSRVADTEKLTGVKLDVAGHAMTIGAAKSRPMSRHATQLARYVAVAEVEDESGFLSWAEAELGAMGIVLKKALCGIARPIQTPHGVVQTRSLLVANLTPENAMLLQVRGLGPHRALGCGLFSAHKGMDPVKKPDDDAGL